MVTLFKIKQIILDFVGSSSKKRLSNEQKNQDLLSIKLKSRKLTKKSVILFSLLTFIRSICPLPVNACSNPVDSTNGVESKPFIEKLFNGYNFNNNSEKNCKDTSSSLQEEVQNNKVEESQQESKNGIKKSKSNSLADRYQKRKLKDAKRIQYFSQFIEENRAENDSSIENNNTIVEKSISLEFPKETKRIPPKTKIKTVSKPKKRSKFLRKIGKKIRSFLSNKLFNSPKKSESETTNSANIENGLRTKIPGKKLAERYREKRLKEAEKEAKRVQSISKFLQENSIEDKNVQEPKIEIRKKTKIPMRGQMMTISKLDELEQRKALKAETFRLPARKLGESYTDYKIRYNEAVTKKYEALTEKYGPDTVSKGLMLEMERMMSDTNPTFDNLDL